MRFPIELFVLTAGFIAGTATACSHACNLMFAPSHVEIELNGDLGVEGDYEVVVSDGQRNVLSCSFSVPVDPDQAYSCSDGSSRVERTPEGDWTSLFAQVTPDPLIVTILLNGEVLVEDTFNPDYAEDEPNGEGCGVRRVAGVEVSW